VTEREDEDLCTCPQCQQEVAARDICEDHGICFWCDEGCKLASTFDEDE